MAKIQSVFRAATLLMLSLHPNTVFADTPRQEALNLFKQGNALYTNGNYKGALDKYWKARALFPNYRIDMNVAKTLDDMGRHTKAAMEYERFLQRADKTAPMAAIKMARDRLDELKKKLSSLKLTCLEKDATIKVNGKIVGTTPVDSRLYLKPGQYLVVVSLAPNEPYRWESKLEAGDHRNLSVKFLPKKSSESKPEEVTSPEINKKSELATNKQEETAIVLPDSLDQLILKKRRGKTIWAWTMLGVSLACVAGAGVMYGVGQSQGDSAYTQYRALTPKDSPAIFDERWADVEAAEQLYIGGHVLIAVAAAALGVSIYQFVTRPSRERLASRAVKDLRLGMAVDGNGAGLVFMGGFK